MLFGYPYGTQAVPTQSIMSERLEENTVDNKRNFYRVQIQIGMRIIPMGRNIPPVEACSHFEDSEAVVLKRKMQTLRQTVNQHLRDIPAELDAISLALHGLQQQIDTLAVAQLKDSDAYHTVKVSLSEGGVGWRQREPLPQGEYLALKLDLDDYKNHCVYGKIQSCQRENDYYYIGVAFQDLEEHELQSIAKFVLQADAEQRRLRRTTS